MVVGAGGGGDSGMDAGAQFPPYSKNIDEGDVFKSMLYGMLSAGRSADISQLMARHNKI